MNSIITLPNGSLQCGCGAECAPKEKGRFLRRHPVKCVQHIERKIESRKFAKQLAQGTRCVDGVEMGSAVGNPSNQTQLVSYQLGVIVSDGSGLTPWETKFISDLGDQWSSKQWISEKQLEILARIYADRT